jgi:predicted Zn finger-like uncharacterized protein
MIVECGECSTKFKIADEKITSRGVKVRCSKCKHLFVVKKGGKTEQIEKPAKTKEKKKPAKPKPAVAEPIVDGPTMKVPRPDGVGIPESVFKAPTKVTAPPPPPPPPPPGKSPPKISAADSTELDDIFSRPTKVGPTPPPVADQKKFPVPPPPLAGDGGKSLADQIDLDGEEPKSKPLPSAAPEAPLSAPPPPVPASTVPPPPVTIKSGAAKPDTLPPPSAVPSAVPDLKSPGATSQPPQAAPKKAPPPATSPDSGLGDDLFGDLSALETEKKQPAQSSVPVPQIDFEPAAAKPPAASQPVQPSATMSDDPFAGIDISNGAQPGPASQPQPAPEPPSPQDSPPSSPDPVSGEAVGKPTEDLFGDLGDSFSEAPPATIPQPLKAAPPAAKADAPPVAPPATPPAATPDPIGAVPSAATPDPFGGAPSAATPDPFGDAPSAATPDPFASLGVGDADQASPEIDLAGPGSQPAQPPMPASSMSDDPFAAIDTTVPSDSPPAGLALDDSGPSGLETADKTPLDSDPFGAGEISTGLSEPGADQGGAFQDSDPFGQLDSAAAEPQDGPGPSGLQLDEDGKLTGDALPEPPPPTKAIQSTNAQAQQAPQHSPASPAPMAPAPAELRRSTGALWVYKVGFGVIALLMALLLFVAYRSGGKPDLTSWDTYVRAFTGESSTVEAGGDLLAVKVANTAYPNQAGHQLVVVWGEVENPTVEDKAAVAVTGKLLSKRGKTRAEFTAPAGIAFTPMEVFKMDDELAVEAAYRSRLDKIADLKIPPGGKVPFMLIFFEHPEEMDDVEFNVHPAVSQDPLRGLPPAPAPVPGPDSEDKSAEGEAETQDKPDSPKAAKKTTPKPAPAPKTPPKAVPKSDSKVIEVKKKGDFIKMKPAAKEAKKDEP